MTNTGDVTGREGLKDSLAPRRMSLADVAEHAGVSLATASRVMSGSPYPVSTETRAKVERAATKLGYSPHALGQALAIGHTRVIGVIVGDILDPYFGEIVRGVEDQARRHGFLTIVCNADRSWATELESLRVLRNYHARGLIFAGGEFRVAAEEERKLAAAVEEAVAEGMRVVSLAARDIPGVITITVDNRAVLYDITTYLASLGHRRIAYADGPVGFSTGELRRQGFLEAVKTAGADACYMIPGGFTYESGRAVALRLLRNMPDAVVAFNDESAVGVLMALREAGVAVPEEISIAGVDGTRDSVLVDLTTVSVPMYELGATAALRIIDPKSHERGNTFILPHRVTPRGTTAPKNS